MQICNNRGLAPRGPRGGGGGGGGGGGITPRTADNYNTVVAYQLTCGLPFHKASSLCTKSLAVSKVGTCESALRRLKFWAIQGLFETSKEDHQSVWQAILKMSDDELPSMEDLEAATPTVVPDEHLQRAATGDTSATSAASEKHRGHEAASSVVSVLDDGLPEDPLGGCAAGTPPALHRRMLALFHKGAIPKTSVETRKRQRLTGGETYLMPPELLEGLHHGYLGPCLPPPSGFAWVRRPSGWTLIPRGG